MNFTDNSVVGSLNVEASSSVFHDDAPKLECIGMGGCFLRSVESELERNGLPYNLDILQVLKNNSTEFACFAKKCEFVSVDGIAFNNGSARVHICYKKNPRT